MAQSPANHLSAAGAARLAARAGVSRLLLTHFHPERQLALSLEEARKNFAAAELAQERGILPGCQVKERPPARLLTVKVQVSLPAKKERQIKSISDEIIFIKQELANFC